MNAKKQDNTSTGESKVDFSLWRMLDHTRFMIFRSREQELEKYGVTPIQSYVLDIVMTEGGTASINTIVEVTQRRHHTISTLVARMERRGLVIRTKDPKDARRWDVAITDEGRELFSRISRDSVEHIFASLAPGDRAALQRSLRNLMNAAYQALGKPVPTDYFG